MAPVETAPPSDPAVQLPWVPLAWFGALLLAAFGPVLARMFQQWMDDPNMGHGAFVPVVAGYIAWQKREQLWKTAAAGSWWGLPVVFYGTLQLLVATLGAELFLARTAFLISLAGALLLICGWQVVRVLGFPLFLLCFMIPIPAIVFNQITFPLQLFASAVAETCLTLVGIPVLREGNVLELSSQRLSVVEACSGIRSLISLSFLSLVYAYFFDKKPWMRWVLLAASVPIAILSNSSRITLTGIISEYDRELAEGFFHTVEGWIIFMVALAMLTVTHQIINRTYTYWHGGK